MIKKLEWDSDFFQKRIGELITAPAFERMSDQNEFDLLYVKSTEDIFFEITNFKQTYTETKVVFNKSIVLTNSPITDKFIISALNEDSFKEQIYQLAFESGKNSRFKLDYNFTEIEFEKLYKKWVDNSLVKEIADDVLVYKIQNTIFGFVTYKIFENYATIGLLGINRKEQGKSIGSKLIQAVENELVHLDIRELRIPTQLHNEQACKFYKKMGYEISEKQIIKHYWKL